ncbi:MAG: nucleotidyl transferase AbiEii/AbiGii toxin family protein [Candidatus Sabulitectum sp.]|nr:nucleotidyl transferase AbiEii/AbiGii toxin family protein [Candidatus Sabulitectum sp.]
MEVDINPPAGAGIEITIIRKFQLLRLQHLDKSSLLAGKIHAVLMRGHTKGRDFYDLAWYLGNREWPEVNMTMLKNALKQSGWTQERINSMNLYKELENRFDNLDWEFVKRDLQPFIEKPAELNILNRNDMTVLLKNLT